MNIATPEQRDATDALVFVDLDRCLLRDDSIGAFLTHMVERRLMPRSSVLRGAIAYIRYRMNWADPESMIHGGVAELAGFPEAQLRAEAQLLFHEVLQYRYRRSVVDAIDAHQRAGRRVFLLTGGLSFLPELIAADLGLAGVCATRHETRDGVCTGGLADVPCVGQGKVVHAQRLALRHGGQVGESWFYTDSYSDLPLLLVARHPVAVNPDRKLREAARRRGWPVVH